MNNTLKRLSAVMILTLVTSVGMAATPDTVRETKPQNETPEPQIWRVDGGDIRMRFNESFLDLFGVKVELKEGVRDPRNPLYAIFPLMVGGKGLKFNAPDGGFDRFVGGQLQARGGFQLQLADGGIIDLRNPIIRPSVDNPMHLEMVGTDGNAWVYITHLMYQFLGDYRAFQVATADLRASPLLAKRVGSMEVADAYIGEVQMDALVAGRSRDVAARPKGGTPNFHGAAHPEGGIYEADVTLQTYTMSFSRCRRSNGSNGCDGVGADDGEVVFTPSATLRNTDTGRTADVPWYEKFTGNTNPYGYPYTNADQHPYLVWNLYRIVDDQLEQIAASGLKHAWLTTNGGCGNPFGNHILSRNCSDTYAVNNNDDPTDLGPRGELLPATGMWGRCGSVYDPGCVGANTNIDPNGNYGSRLIVRESQMLTSGATFWSDAWYVVQDDINIFNTMGHRPMSPAPGATAWIPGSQGGSMTPGPVINTWVNPTTNPMRNIELRSEAGRARVAVKTKLLDACPVGSGLTGTCYRYDYAVHNFDFATAESTSGTPPNFRVTGAKGFDSFKLILPARTTVFIEPAVNFADTDINPANNWTASVTAGAVEWAAPVDNTLNWGTLYRFSVVSDAAPTTDLVGIDLGVANPRPGLVTLEGNMVGPAGLGNGIMKNGFE